jgi:hypothetical protein
MKTVLESDSCSRDEPDPVYERESEWEWEAIAEAQMRAYLANQEANDEVLARWRVESYERDSRLG